MKKLFSSYAFWVALASAVAIFLEDFCNLVGVKINVSIIESLIMSFCGVLVVLGIVRKKDENNSESEEDEKLDDIIEENILEEAKDNSEENKEQQESK